ncbi:hypothetical protein ACFTXK_22525 [Streptomyces sp. NPDC056956]|uniref:hypothetical protein n=1 Tax=Streptomyces sp. NPDC056956 TaxID=3345980 RepID=UPI003640BAEC
MLATTRLQLRDKKQPGRQYVYPARLRVQKPRRTHVTMFMFPLFLGIVSLSLGLATRNNYRGFRDWLVKSPVNIAPGDEKVPAVFKKVGANAISIGIFMTIFGVIFAIFS